LLQAGNRRHGACAMLDHWSMNTDRAKAGRELLAFYVEAGADAPLSEAPVDHLADELVASPSAPVKAPRALARKIEAAPASPPSPDAATMAAREVAKSAATLDELRAILDRFEGCALRSTATRLVFADGNPQSRVMFVGEAPGRDEDIEGLPFVGRAGKLLDRMLAAVGLDRTCVYIANIVPWRPPGNRTPTPQEAQICLPFLHRQIELVDPDILVCLGNPSAQTLLGLREGITRTRGRWFTFHTGTREIRAIPTLHPAYLLRQPLQKRLAWRDFLALKKALNQPPRT
jgi:uracil-DNA glycosylase